MEKVPFVGGRHHQTIRHFDIPEDYFTWAFVRNPCDRLLSFHTSMKYWRPSNYTWMPDSFEEFVLGLPNYVYRRVHTLTQFYMLADNDGQVALDFIGRFESLRRDWKTVCYRVGVPYYPLPIENTSEHKPWQEVYTRQMEKIVAHHYRIDYETFDYREELS